MKPLYSDAEVQFRQMKEQPDEKEWWPVNRDNYHSAKFCREIPKFPYRECVTITAPFLPGEKCYLREVWKVDRIEEDLVIRYKSDNAVIYIHESNDSDVLALIDLQEDPWRWRSPVTLPQWAARRFFTIVSCEPVRVSEVTEEDCLKMGFEREMEIDGSTGWGAGLVTAKDKFLKDWHLKHPGKEWAWRIEVEEEK